MHAEKSKKIHRDKAIDKDIKNRKQRFGMMERPEIREQLKQCVK